MKDSLCLTSLRTPIHKGRRRLAMPPQRRVVAEGCSPLWIPLLELRSNFVVLSDLQSARSTFCASTSKSVSVCVQSCVCVCVRVCARVWFLFAMLLNYRTQFDLMNLMKHQKKKQSLLTDSKAMVQQ